MMTELDKKWASELSNEELISEMTRVAKRLNQGFGEGSGSPGEWWYERWDELERARQLRGI